MRIEPDCNLREVIGVAILTPVREPACDSDDLKNIALLGKASADVHANTVLSFSFEKNLLPPREAALRNFGYKVFSTTSEACVRFEIQMGRCGVLLLCYTIPGAIRHDLAALFERHCHSGVIASVTHPLTQEETQPALICTLDSDFPQKLQLIKDAAKKKSLAAH
jgi:hypothetical protein